MHFVNFILTFDLFDFFSIFFQVLPGSFPGSLISFPFISSGVLSMWQVLGLALLDLGFKFDRGADQADSASHSEKIGKCVCPSGAESEINC